MVVDNQRAVEFGLVDPENVLAFRIGDHRFGGQHEKRGGAMDVLYAIVRGVQVDLNAVATEFAQALVKSEG